MEELIRQIFPSVGGIVYSTGVEEVDASSLGSLFNVIGSTDDPEVDGLNWKNLFLSYFPDADECYVISGNTPVRGKSHPQFDVGGHVCTGSSRELKPNEDCYLMPLCKAHNNGNDYEFITYHTPILKLKGYMTADVALTFMARMDDELPYSLVFSQGDNWFHANISHQRMLHIIESESLDDLGFGNLEDHILLKRHEDEGLLRVVKTTL